MVAVVSLAGCGGDSRSGESPPTSSGDTDPGDDADAADAADATDDDAADAGDPDGRDTTTDDGRGVPDDEPAPHWWYAAGCAGASSCRPPVPASVPDADLVVENPTDHLQVVDAGAVLGGGPIGLLEIDAADVQVVGLEIDTIVLGPEADGAVLEGNRIGQVFVNGADGVVIRRNLLRPTEVGPDVIQVKTFDEDQPEDLLVVENVIGPQDSDGERHTDCVQILGGDRLRFSRNIVFPCGDKAFQIRSGAGGVVGSVALDGNVLYECPVQRPGCEGFHAIVWASTPETSLALHHNTILGSIGVSTSGSTSDPGANFVARGNLALSMPCTDSVDHNLVVDDAPCGVGGIQAALPAFLDADPSVGDIRLADPEAVPVAADAYGPSIDGSASCATPRLGAATACGPPDF